MTTYGKIRLARALFSASFLAGLALFAVACSTGAQNSGLALVDTQGNHPSSFLSTHPAVAVSDVEQCKTCHGDDLAGGIAKVSCFTAACHHGTIPTWADSSVHGASAKQAPGSSGFAACRICHGTDFSTRLGTPPQNCFDCHGVNAPHPAAPWRASTGVTHTGTDPANAPVCAACHFPGSPNNPAGHPATPASAGTPPGCFNNTLCHGPAAAPHILGADWRDPAVGGANFHGLTAKQDLAFCQTCHGTPGTIRFDGGSAPTACSACHTAAGAHPTTWFEAPQTGFPPYTTSHRNAGGITTVCAICHKVDGPGAGPNPAAPSCFSGSFTNADGVVASCHAGGPGAAPHSIPFLNHTSVTAATFNDPFPAGCASCHAVTGTSPVSSAPLCTSCHTGGSPLTLSNCTSCHAEPPDGPTATAPYPNKTGAHITHLGLDSAGTPVSCGTCHAGLGSGAQAHYDRAKTQVPPGDTAFAAAYDAKSGAPSFDNVALTCSNVSCHGGQATPDWRTGTLDVSTQCTSCHTFGTSQYNSYNSGRHNLHVNAKGFSCTVCHNTASLAAGHLSALSTTAMEGPASATIGGGSTFIPAGNYNPSTGSCNPSCHGTKDW